MLASQLKPQAFEHNFVYELVSDSSLPPIDSFTAASSHITNQTNPQQTDYKCWNPATIEGYPKPEQQQQQIKDVDRLIGELK